METTSGESHEELSQAVLDDLDAQFKGPVASVAIASTVTSSIWNTLSEDEQRMRRLRDRLAALRESTGQTSNVKEEETGNICAPSDSSVGSNSTLTTHSTASIIPSQEEARLLSQSRTTFTSIPPRLPHHYQQQQHLDSQQQPPLSQTSLNGRHESRAMPSPLPPLPPQQFPGSNRVSPRHLPPKLLGAKIVPSSSEPRMNSLAALEERAIREAGKNYFQPAASTTAQSGQQQGTGIRNQLEQEEERLLRNLPQVGQRQEDLAGGGETTDNAEVVRRRVPREAMDEKHRLQSPQPSPSRRPRPRAPLTDRRQYRVGAFSIEGRSSNQEEKEEQEPTNVTRPSLASLQSSMTSVIPVAAMIVEDFEREELSAKEQQLREQERELAEKMQRLQAWEAELQRQRDELEQRQRMGTMGSFLDTSTIVEAELVEAEHPEPSRGIFSSFLQTRQHSRQESDDFFTANTHSSKHSTDDYSSACGSLYDQTICTNDSVRTDEAIARLGEGPMRFFSHGERSLEDQIQSLSIPNKRAYNNLKQSWQDYQIKIRSMGGKRVSFDMPTSWHLRYLRFTAKKDGTFNPQRAFQAEKKLKRRFLNLNVFVLERQLKTKTLFPVPGLRTRGGHAMFYMRPARYVPGKTTTKAIIDNLNYVMNTMLENEHAQQEGIGFIACMDEWKMKNFEVNYCYQFMMSLQGFMVPVKTQLFLIVNPPAWFGVIWRIMKPMLAPSFRTRVKICNETKISKYLAPDFASHLPDDMSSGQVPTDAIVEDFISYRRHLEASLVSPRGVATRSDDGHSTSRQSHESPFNEEGFDQLSWHDDFPTSERSSVARAKRPSDNTDRSIASAGESTGSGRGQSFHYDDDDDLASIDANIEEDHLSDDEDMKEPPSSTDR